MKKRSVVVQRRLNIKKQNRQLEHKIIEVAKTSLMLIGAMAVASHFGIEIGDHEYMGVHF